MREKIKTFFQNVDLVDIVISIALLCFAVYVIWTSVTPTEADIAENSTEVVADNVYEDMVFVVAVTDSQMRGYRYREILFSNAHYLCYKEQIGSQVHRDFNHPLYVETQDLCRVRVEVNGDQETVTLLRNLSKEELSETGSPWEDDRSDLD